VSIHDNGPGMSAAERVRIFEPFFTTKAVGAGTGLGLSTALTITKEHGGAIACESAPGTGTTFRFYLPTAEPPPCEAPANAEPTPAGGHEGILVVDDETLVRQAVTRLLEAEGYKVFSAPSGAEALRLLDDAQASDDIGLVLLDMSMPGMTGAQVRNELKRSFPRLRVAYFSGYLLDGADDVEAVIAKPIQATHLLETVRKLLDRAQT
jgi:CheY-like chemotaxis protein